MHQLPVKSTTPSMFAVSITVAEPHGPSRTCSQREVYQAPACKRRSIKRRHVYTTQPASIKRRHVHTKQQQNIDSYTYRRPVRRSAPSGDRDFPCENQLFSVKHQTSSAQNQRKTIMFRQKIIEISLNIIESCTKESFPQAARRGRRACKDHHFKYIIPRF